MVSSCASEGEVQERAGVTASRPSILLVTLDTTRADSVGPAAQGVETRAFNALAARGRLFTRAYATAPETLPAHASMMTGLYAAGHGVHENGRSAGAGHAVLAEQLQRAGYRTAAFVSSFVLSRRFGLGRGFHVYNEVADTERSAMETTDLAVEYLRESPQGPQFLWVHYFDAHAPYAPPEPFRTQYAKNPYLGEIAAVDAQMERLVEAFETKVEGPPVILVVGDHGEGLGDHGESQHGLLLYESTMRVPLVLVAPQVTAGVANTPVSARRVYQTLLEVAGLDATLSLRAEGSPEIVMGEAMKPHLEYGWQPQVMAVEGNQKAIVAGTTEVYDVEADPMETRDLADTASLSRPLRTAMRDYPVPSPGEARTPDSLSEEDRRKLASLGYVGSTAAPAVRRDAPRPADMSRLFDVMEKASGLFIAERYAQVIPLLERILKEDAHNLDAALRLATAHSALGHEAQADRMFERALDLSPASVDVRLYLALHRARGTRWEEAVPMLERVVAEAPDRLPAIEALARIRERQKRPQEAIALYERIHALREPSGAELLRLGELAMEIENTPLAIQSFTAARELQGDAFRHHLELGVLYLAARRFEEARDSLDLVGSNHPDYPMALFKRAQVSVLLREPDQRAKVDLARRHATPELRALIDRERLFQEMPGR